MAIGLDHKQIWGHRGQVLNLDIGIKRKIK